MDTARRRFRTEGSSKPISVSGRLAILQCPIVGAVDHVSVGDAIHTERLGRWVNGASEDDVFGPIQQVDAQCCGVMAAAIPLAYKFHVKCLVCEAELLKLTRS